MRALSVVQTGENSYDVSCAGGRDLSTTMIGVSRPWVRVDDSRTTLWRWVAQAYRDTTRMGAAAGGVARHRFDAAIAAGAALNAADRPSVAFGSECMLGGR